MAMIRQADLDRSPRQALVMNVENIRAQAEAVVESARLAAAEIIADARAERERILAGAAEVGRAKGQAEGLARGLAEGREAGRAEARKEMVQRLTALEATWSAALSEFIARRDALLRECEGRGLELALLMGERLARRAIEVDPGAVMGRVGEVLDLATRSTRLTLAVHPADEALVRQSLPALLALDASQRHVALVADASIPPGSCVARTEGGGTLDARFEACLDAIVTEILPQRDHTTIPEEGEIRLAPDTGVCVGRAEAGGSANAGGAAGGCP